MPQDVGLEDWNSVSHLFDSHTILHPIIFQCARLGMGILRVDNLEAPTAAYYSIPLMSFLGGDCTSRSAIALVESVPSLSIIVTPDKGWRALVQSTLGSKMKTQHRTRLSPKDLDVAHIRSLKKGLPKEYMLHEVDIDSLSQFEQDYKKQIEIYFGSLEGLLREGIGYCIEIGNRVVSFAYTPFPFIDEFEIQVFTRNDARYRRKGLATVVSAALIEHGIECGLVPHWDAANEASVELALKLGYSDPVPYDVYYYLPEK